MLEPKEGTKEGKKESAIAIGSKRSGGTWKNGGLVGYSLRYLRVGQEISLHLTNDTKKNSRNSTNSGETH